MTAVTAANDTCQQQPMLFLMMQKTHRDAQNLEDVMSNTTLTPVLVVQSSILAYLEFR